MTRAGTLRLLRITVSVVCGIVCLLLIALWVRSYWRADELTMAARLRLTSIYGCIQYKGPVGRWSFEKDWGYLGWRPSRDEIRAITQTEPTPIDLDPKAKAWLKRFGGLGVGRPSTAWRGSVPFWAVVCVVATLTVAPWIRQFRWRFSLRTLLLVTTLVAVMLGLVVAMR
jgi:hypothetical protein